MWQAGTCHAHVPNGCAQGQGAGKGSPSRKQVSTHPAPGPRRGWSLKAERGLPVALPALAVSARHVALRSRVLFKVQRVFL